MPEEKRKSAHQLTEAIMKGVKLMRLSAFIAAVAAGLTSWTALNVYRGEQERIDYEKLRFAHTTYHAYIEYRRQRTTNTLKCTEAFTRRKPDTDSFIITDDDLRGILLHDRGEIAFDYSRDRYAGLIECVDEPEIKTLLVKDHLDGKEVRQLLDAIDEKLAWAISTLDAALVGYFNDLGDKVTICENFSGFLMTGRDKVGYGIPGVYLQRLAKINLIRDENYPNLYKFLFDIATVTNDFTGKVNCTTQMPLLYPVKPKLLQVRDWSVKQFHEWVW
jgi:hypothetical protein